MVVRCNLSTFKLSFVCWGSKTKNKKNYAKAVGIFTSTKKNGKWGLQLRIMIPASGDVTLAGARIN